MTPASDLDLLPTEIEEDLRASVRDVLADQCDPNVVTALYDGDRKVVGGLWKTLSADLGLAGLLIPESHGGHGASAREAAVVAEELGRAAAPTPFLTSAVIATTVLLDSGSPLLAELAAGTRTAALAVPWSTGPYEVLPALSSEGDRITGTITSVAGALEADLLLVPVSTPDRIAVCAVDADAVSREPVVSLDMTRQLADLTFDRAPGPVVLADAEPAIRHALTAGAALLAAEQVGVSRWCLETTVSYLKVRRQFGRVVGGFQALKHRLADLYTEIESGSAAAGYAAATLAADDPDVSIAAAVAQSYCGDMAVHAAEEAVQLHAGIGMTWEHPAHLYLKRAKADQLALGSPGAHRAALARLADLPPAPVRPA